MGFLNDDCNGKNKKFRRNNVFFSNSCFPLGKTISSSSKFRSLVVSTSIFPKKSQPTKNNSLKKKTTLKKRVATSPPPQPVDEIGGTSYKLHTSLSFARVPFQPGLDVATTHDFFRLGGWMQCWWQGVSLT